MIKEQLKEMLAIQDELNKQLNPDWINQGWDFVLAAKIEMTEAIDHHGWKWWKKQEPDIEQCKMEMADILHFLLSRAIVVVDSHGLAKVFEQEFSHYRGSTFVFNAKEFISHTDLRLAANYFAQACLSLGMDWQELRGLYLGKGILNKFRWANGYDDGTYVKVWNGLEDNEYLTGIIAAYPDWSADEIYTRLQEVYDAKTKPVDTSPVDSLVASN